MSGIGSASDQPSNEERLSMRVYYDRDADVGLIKKKRSLLLVWQSGPCPCSKLER